MSTMYDTANPDAELPDPEIIAGYIDGDYVSLPGLMERYPDATHLSITVRGASGARICDCEAGDLTPAQAANWCKNEIFDKRRPTVYCSLDIETEVWNALTAIGIERTEVDWWIADWTGEAHTIPGTVGVQYANPPKSGGDYDLSEVDIAWAGSSGSTGEPPAPPAPVEPTTTTITVRILKLNTPNMRGQDVTTAQTLLSKKANQAIEADGIFGPETQSAAKALQAFVKAEPTGIIDASTWDLLINE
jgi:Putative peptidoglycan binding domain